MMLVTLFFETIFDARRPFPPRKDPMAVRSTASPVRASSIIGGFFVDLQWMIVHVQ